MKVGFSLLAMCFLFAGCDHFEVRSDRVVISDQTDRIYVKLQTHGWSKYEVGECSAPHDPDANIACVWKEFPMKCRALFVFPYTCKKSVTVTIFESQNEKGHWQYSVSTLGATSEVKRVADRASAEIKNILGD